MKNNHRNKQEAGLSLIEVMFYLAIMVVLIAAIIMAVQTSVKNYRIFKATQDIEKSAVYAMEKIVREGRSASSIDFGQSLFNTNPGSIAYISTDTAGHSTTTKIYFDAGQIKLVENGINLGALTSSNIKVSSLIFRNTSTSSINSVRIEMTLDSATSSPVSLSKTFYNTMTSRSSY